MYLWDDSEELRYCMIQLMCSEKVRLQNIQEIRLRNQLKCTNNLREFQGKQTGVR